MQLDHLRRTKRHWCLWTLFFHCLLCTENTQVFAQESTTELTTPTTLTTLQTTTDVSDTTTATTTPLRTQTSATMTASTVTMDTNTQTGTTNPPCIDGDNSINNNSMVIAVVVLCIVLVIFIISTVLLAVAVCCLFSRIHTKENENKQYVFEEGVEPPRLWLDTQNSPLDNKPDDREPNVWEVSTTFSPSPDSKHTTMNLPSDSSGSIQQAPVTARPAVPPMKPVPVHKKVKPKRVAPPPPKKSKKKKQNKMSTVYDVPPSPYLEPVSSAGAQQSPRENERVYDVPKRQRKWMKWPNNYKEIDVSKVNPPNPYADLVIRPTK